MLNKHLTLVPDIEMISLASAQKRILAKNIFSPIDVPGFDRATMDGFAVIAEDTFGAEESRPKRLKIVDRVEAGEIPKVGIKSGEAIEISTGHAASAWRRSRSAGRVLAGDR